MKNLKDIYENIVGYSSEIDVLNIQLENLLDETEKLLADNEKNVLDNYDYNELLNYFLTNTIQKKDIVSKIIFFAGLDISFVFVVSFIYFLVTSTLPLGIFIYIFLTETVFYGVHLRKDFKKLIDINKLLKNYDGIMNDILDNNQEMMSLLEDKKRKLFETQKKLENATYKKEEEEKKFYRLLEHNIQDKLEENHINERVVIDQSKMQLNSKNIKVLEYKKDE